MIIITFNLSSLKDWTAALNELKNFGDSSPSLRNAEANLLENDDGTNSLQGKEHHCMNKAT